MAWAHPRSRGENPNTSRATACVTGSSPLTRGKPVKRWNAGRIPRLIPAHAGKTTEWSPGSPTRRAHPRSRGENRCVPSRPSRTVGSSPLTRGKPHRGVPDRAGTGLIPAHAGKTGLRPIPVRAEWAHPRSRGENGIVMLIEPAGGGSSPLTRGKRYAVSSRNDQSGLIPAHAGKTSRRRSRSLLSGAHPRSRGENGKGPDFAPKSRGSSPLTRGKRDAKPTKC